MENIWQGVSPLQLAVRDVNSFSSVLIFIAPNPMRELLIPILQKRKLRLGGIKCVP